MSEYQPSFAYLFWVRKAADDDHDETRHTIVYEDVDWARKVAAEFRAEGWEVLGDP